MIYPMGTKFGDLTLVERIPGSRKLKTKTIWRLVCKCGVITESQSSNVTSGKTTSCGAHGRGDKRRATDLPKSYEAVHTQLRVQRGSASNYTCTDCDSRACDWSYDGLDHRELFGIQGVSLMAYSTDIYGHYDPRCRQCHITHDKATRDASNIVLDALGRAA